MATLGINPVKVLRKPKVGIIVTGSELIEPGEPFQDYTIYNCNGLVQLEKGVKHIVQGSRVTIRLFNSILN